MRRKLKNTASILLLIVFLFPTIIKLEHHHEHFECNTKHTKHLHENHEKCDVCNFEFSLFSIEAYKIDFEINQLFTEYHNDYISVCFSENAVSFFLLRAPPSNKV